MDIISRTLRVKEDFSLVIGVEVLVESALFVYDYLLGTSKVWTPLFDSINSGTDILESIQMVDENDLNSFILVLFNNDSIVSNGLLKSRGFSNNLQESIQ
jgi:hypothetical protein